MATVTTTLREALKTCGVSRYRVSADTGIPPPTLHRFVVGESRLRSDNIDMLAEYLGLELRPKRDKSRLRR